MFKTKSILNELQSLISRYEFEKLVSEQKADKNVRNFRSWDMLKVMMFSQLSKKSSIRDIVTSLRSRSNNWAHMGLKSISRNNLSNSLMKRSSKIFEKTFYMLYEKMMEKGYSRTDKRFKVSNKLTAIDSTTIPLCLNVCKWAKFRKAKGGIKIHTMFDIKKQLPEFIIVSNASKHDSTQIKKMKFEENGIYVMDKGYFGIKIFKKINKTGAFFITRTKINTKYRVIRRFNIGGPNKIEDLVVDFTNPKKKEYPDRLRVVRYFDCEKDKEYEFITNNFEVKAEEVAAIYKARWDIELFFKHIKQNLKIKRFFGTSENAVKIQVWAAMITVLLAEFMRFISRTKFSSMEVIRIVGENIFNGKSIMNLLNPDKYQPLEHRRQLLDLQLSLEW